MRALPLVLGLSVLVVACGEGFTDFDPLAGEDGGTPPGKTDSGIKIENPIPDASVEQPKDAGPTGPTCGDMTCNGAETCESCAKDCGACPVIPCDSEGGLYCGGNTVGGDTKILYVCQGGSLKIQQACGGPCQYMPAGTPDRCPPTGNEPPASLVTKLSVKPYVEQSCTAATFNGWPHAAQKCSYSSGPLSTTVIVANPSPDRVARWIVDAATYIPALDALKGTNPGVYEEGLKAIAQHMLIQSSRIFPLNGGIIENMGSGYVNYYFELGVTRSCSGCYCRINSLHRNELCNYRASIGTETADACMARIGGSNWTAAWGDACFQNHLKSWTTDSNEHFRAKAHTKNQSVKSKCPTPTSCTPSQVLSAVQAAYSTI